MKSATFMGCSDQKEKIMHGECFSSSLPSLTLVGLSEAPREECASSGRNVGASDGEPNNAPRWDLLARRRTKRQTKKKKEEDAMATSKEVMLVN